MSFPSDSLKAKILETVLSNLRLPTERRVGVEIETILYDKQLRRLPVNLGSGYSAQDLIKNLVHLQKNENDPCIYSLEPGGQLEWASLPFVSLHEINSQWNIHTKILEKLCADNSLIPIDFALEPIYLPDEIDLINSTKYRLMNDRFKSVGSRGPWMMRNSASVQVNIDITCKEDGEEMALVADCLQPFCFLLFSHVPFIHGKCAENKNYRLRVWNNTDSSRCGYLLDHGINQNQNLLESFVDYMLSVPAIFILNQNSDVTGYEGSLGEWLYSLNDKGKLSPDYIQLALHQIFTHVRFKHVLEVRGADRPPFGYELAPAAFWCGLLTAPDVRKSIFERVCSWSIKERLSLNKTAETLDLTQVGPEGISCGEWLKIISDLAIQGLDERAEFFEIKSERRFLEPFINKALSRPWALRVQDSFKETGGSLMSYLQENYLK